MTWRFAVSLGRKRLRIRIAAMIDDEPRVGAQFTQLHPVLQVTGPQAQVEAQPRLAQQPDAAHERSPRQCPAGVPPCSTWRTPFTYGLALNRATYSANLSESGRPPITAATVGCCLLRHRPMTCSASTTWSRIDIDLHVDRLDDVQAAGRLQILRRRVPPVQEVGRPLQPRRPDDFQVPQVLMGIHDRHCRRLLVRCGPAALGQHSAGQQPAGGLLYEIAT